MMAYKNYSISLIFAFRLINIPPLSGFHKIQSVKV